jgi:hypothetical protein
MGYTFRIVFSGLCAFVPDRSFDANPGPSSITVLLPNLLTPIPLSNKILTPHYPTLEFDLAQRQPGSTKKVPLVRPDSDTAQGDKGLCFLLGEDLKINAQSQGAAELHLVNGHNGGDATEANNGDRNSVWWMAKLDKAATGAGLARRAMQPPGAPNSSEIISRLQLSRGVLSSWELVSGVCKFDRHSTYKQQIAREVAWELRGVTGPVEIDFTSFGVNPKTDKLILEPPAGPGGVQVEIRNLEIDAFLFPEYDPQRGTRATDFEVYYRMCSGFSGPNLPAPVLSAPPPPDSVHELCPPVAFSGWSA